MPPATQLQELPPYILQIWLFPCQVDAPVPRSCPGRSTVHGSLLPWEWAASPITGYKWFHLQTSLLTENETTWEPDFIASPTLARKARLKGAKILKSCSLLFLLKMMPRVPCALSLHPVSRSRIETVFLTHCIIWVNTNDSVSKKSSL